MIQQITPLPTPPQPGDSPADFDQKSFSLLGGLPQFVTETNALGVQVFDIGESAGASALDAEASKNAAATSASNASSSALSASTSASNAVSSANAANQAKLDAQSAAVAAEASAQSVDTAFLRNRINHTGPLNWAWATYGGTANAVALTPAFARAEYAVGDKFRFRATATNTGATTINVGGLGAKSAVTVTGAALPAGYIRTDVDTVCVYDGTRFVVQRAVETGSNANGVWTRYEDGRQKCQFIGTVSQDVSSVYGGGIYIGTRTWVFPAAFIAAPVVNVGVFRYQTSASWGSVLGNPSGTQASLRIYDVFSGSAASTELSVSAEGRWY